jgi:hypothetical protein
VNRSMLSVGLIALLAVVTTSAYAQQHTVTRPVPMPVSPARLDIPAQAYTTNTTLAGVPGRTGNLDTKATWSTFNQPALVTTDAAAGKVYVMDTLNEAVRVVVGGRVETFASRVNVGSMAGVAIDPTSEMLVFTYQGDNRIYTLRRGAPWPEVFPAVEMLPTGPVPARFSSPAGIIRDDQGSFYIADSGNNAIRKMTRAGVVTTFARGGFDFGPRAIARDPRDGSIYAVSSYGVYRVAPTGQVTPYAGVWNGRGLADGFGAAARFNDPRGIAVDGFGRVFVADAQVQADGTSRGFIRQIAFVPPSPIATAVGVEPPASGTCVSTLAFQGSAPIPTGGPAAALSRPSGLALWSNQLVVVDGNASTVDILH